MKNLFACWLKFGAILFFGMAVHIGFTHERAYSLPAAPLAIATDAELFSTFAETMRVEIERELENPAMIDEAATLKVLLSSRVHLAHYFADDEKAVATAAWIRSLQPDPLEKAFAGLTTFAAVAARRAHPGLTASDPSFRAAFAREFALQLKPLPHTAAMVSLLRRQKEKIAALDEVSLLVEVREQIIPAMTRRGFCSLIEADQLIRVRHRLVNILPVQTETLAALDAAIAARIKL